MAHYALLDEFNKVIEVIPGKDENEGVSIDWEAEYTNVTGKICKRTSYNTRAGKHTSGGIPFRKNYAGIGYTYDSIRDAFIPPKPFESWILDEETCNYMPPFPPPDNINPYFWDESTLQWILFEENNNEQSQQDVP